MFDNAQSLYKQLTGEKPKQIEVRDQSLPFMIEVFNSKTGKTEKEFILPINPESYRISYPTRTQITYTQTGSFQDNIGAGYPKIAISGTFGLVGGLVRGHCLWAVKPGQDAWSIYKDMEDTFLDFYKQFGTYDSRGMKVTNPVDQENPPELRFLNFTDEEYWIVQLDKLELLRNTQRQFLYQYDIQMTGIRRFDSKITYDTMVDSLTFLKAMNTDNLSLWGEILDTYAKVNNAITTVVNGIEGIKDDITNLSISIKNFRNGISRVISAPFGLVKSVSEGIDSILETAVSIGDIPHEFVDQMRSLKRDVCLLNLHEDKFYTETSKTGVSSTNETTSGKLEIVTAKIPESARLRQDISEMDTPETTLFNANMEIAAEAAVKIDSVTDGDSIETIAYRTTGDATQWQKLVVLNELEYPYIASGMEAYTPAIETGKANDDLSAGATTVPVSGITPIAGEIIVLGNALEHATVAGFSGGTVTLAEPLTTSHTAGTQVTRHERTLSVLKPGDRIKIPRTASEKTPIVGSEDFDTRMYGTDEYLDRDGNQNASYGDTETVSGLDNLVMQLRHRLMTLPGELAAVGHPEYGSRLPLLIGNATDRLAIERIKLEAKICVLQDPRIESVSRVELVAENSAFYVEVTAIPIGQTASQNLTIPIV